MPVLIIFAYVVKFGNFQELHFHFFITENSISIIIVLIFQHYVNVLTKKKNHFKVNNNHMNGVVLLMNNL